MPYFKTSDELSLSYTDQGTGKPILCLAGLTRCSLDFRYFEPHANKYRMITLDSRGRGASQYDSNYMNYNVLREAQDVIELLDHLSLAKTAVLGTSRGGLIAMTLAAIAKDRLSGVILNDIGPDLPNVGLQRIMEYVGRPPTAKTHESAAAQLKTAMTPAFSNVPSERWLEEARTFYTQTETGLTLRYDPKLRDAMIEQASAGPLPDLWPVFGMLADLPLGALRGGQSDILTAATFAKMQTERPDMVCAKLADRGHVPFLDETASLRVIHSVMEQII